MTKIASRRINSPFLIGLFVTIGTFVLVLAIFWLGASQFLKERIYFVTYFEGSVEGLETGSSVKYLGVPVGTVSKIRVATDGKLIEVIMQIDRILNISDSLRVKAEIAGITGGKFLQLFYPNKTFLLEQHPYLNFKAPFPLIHSSPSGIDEFETAARQVMTKLTKFDLEALTGETINFLQSTSDFFKNQDMINALANIRQSSEHLTAIMARADTTHILGNVSKASTELLEATEDLKKFTSILNRNMDDFKLNSYLKSAFMKYDSTLTDARNSLQLMSYSFESTILNFNDVLEQLKLSNKQFRRTLRTWSENPGELLLREPPPVEK
ncbi:MAG: MlaD family protein [Candidatus Kapabacteria bacterium]|nr:MlaD family protein [Candidatus Kapabacteria bacterium]